MSRLPLLVFCLLGVAACQARAPGAGVGDGGPGDMAVAVVDGADKFVYPDIGAAPDLAAACSNCPDAPVPLVTLPLECLCPWYGPSCPATVEDFVRRYCHYDASLVRMSGCGKVTFAADTRFSGTFPTFDLASGRLIGVHDWSDTGFGRCRASAYIYGTGLFPADISYAPPADVCADITFCTMCGPPDPRYPRCPS